MLLIVQSAAIVPPAFGVNCCKFFLMKRLLIYSVLALASIASFSQKKALDNTLLWRISGNNLAKPSYLFGTIHLLCADDIQLSDSLTSAISKADKVYLELDLDNMFELMSVMTKMKMRNDTTLADLLTSAEYEKVKAFFKKEGGMLPFSMLEKYKPLLTASTIMQSNMSCSNAISMEQLIMKEAKDKQVGIKGLETMAYQMSIFDSIPYSLQAKQLVNFVNDFGKKKEGNELDELTKAYRDQALDKMEEITKRDDMGIANFTDILLYNRNIAWVKKLQELLPQSSLVVAVGAGHLPGEKGVIQLLRKAGYKVEPVKNDMVKKIATKQL